MMTKSEMINFSTINRYQEDRKTNFPFSNLLLEGETETQTQFEETRKKKSFFYRSEFFEFKKWRLKILYREIPFSKIQRWKKMRKCIKF